MSEKEGSVVGVVLMASGSVQVRVSVGLDMKSLIDDLRAVAERFGKLADELEAEEDGSGSTSAMEASDD